MKNFIFTGTSGVGKTYLEEVLQEKYNFYPLIKYTDRDPRPGEVNTNAIQFIGKDGFNKAIKSNEFIFTLSYVGNRYGWKRKDIEAHANQHLTLAVTLESMKKIFDSLPNYVPILLYIKKDNFGLIEQRMKMRENYDSLDNESKTKVDEKIKQRLLLADQETKNIQEYIKIIEDHNGKVFTIKDDNTLFGEVIPFILKECRIEK